MYFFLKSCPYLGSVSDDELDTGRGRLEELHSLLVMLALHTHPVHTQQLVSSLQPPVSVRHAARDDPGDVDGRVLLLPAHHVEAEPLLGLGQLHHPGVGVALRGRECCHRGLRCGGGPDIRGTCKVRSGRSPFVIILANLQYPRFHRYVDRPPSQH